MRMASLNLLALGVSSLLLGACSQTESDGVLTTAIYADLSARAEGGTTTVSGTLRVGGGASLTFVNLVGDDYLEAEMGGQTRRMAESELLDIVSYSVTFDEAAVDTEFRIGLVRTIDDGAPTSVATLPEPFVFSGTPGPTSRAEAFEIVFVPVTAGDPIAWELEGPCVARQTGTLEGDTSALQLPAAGIVANAGSEAETCEVEVTLTRQRTGTLDPGYDGGKILGEQQEVVRFDSMP